MAAIRHFLLVFNHETGQLVDNLEFGEDTDAAVAQYTRLEEQYRKSPMMDIVLVGSDSIETVKLTHANYFDGSAAVSSKYLAGI